MWDAWQRQRTTRTDTVPRAKLAHLPAQSSEATPCPRQAACYRLSGNGKRIITTESLRDWRQAPRS
jgi:hypothetical protein